MIHTLLPAEPARSALRKDLRPALELAATTRHLSSEPALTLASPDTIQIVPNLGNP